MNAWALLYILIFGGALGVSALFCAVARAAGLRLGWLDYPGGRKAHPEPVAVTGGYGIYFTFALLIGTGALASNWIARMTPESLATVRPYLQNITGVRMQILALLAGATLMFIIGAIDDRKALGPRIKLVGQMIAIIPLIAAGISIHAHLPTPLGWIVTLFWIVLITNSFNLLDNMDGLSASVAVAACAVLALAAWQGGQLWMPALFLSFAGTLCGFLIFNWHPAKMFMGDAGSLVIGYLMAVFSILVTYQDVAGGARATPLTLLMPLAIMGVPLFDTLSVMFIRWRAGKPLMVGDRNHFSHRLLAMGFGVSAAAATIALLTAATGLLALPLRWLEWEAATIHVIGLTGLFGVIIALEIAGRKRA